MYPHYSILGVSFHCQNSPFIKHFSDILYSPLLITETGMLSLLTDLVEFKTGNFNKVEEPRISFFNKVEGKYCWDETDTPPESVAIVPVKGFIQKSEGWYGTSTLRLMRMIDVLMANSNVLAIVIDGDSSGGIGSNMRTTAEFIASRALKKPILLSYNGNWASAAYGLGLGCTKIFASQKTDLTGSVGVFTTIVSRAKYLQKQGIKVHDIYSDLSGDKNKPWAEAAKGNYALLKEQVLNPMASDFHDLVRQFRPKIDASVFSGSLYMSEEAIGLGLVDGLLKMEDVVGLAYSMATKRSSKTYLNMQYPKFKNLVGFGEITYVGDRASFSKEQVDAIHDALPETESGEEKILSNLKTIADSITSLEKKVETNALSISSLSNSDSGHRSNPSGKKPDDLPTLEPGSIEAKAAERDQKALEDLFG